MVKSLFGDRHSLFLYSHLYKFRGENMNKIISLTGHKNCGKVRLAYDLAKNSAVEYITPFTDKPVPLEDIDDDLHYVSKDTLDLMIESEEVLSETMIDGYRYVFFKSQLTSAYNVLILDDYALADVKTKWKNLYSIKVYGENQIDSDRVGVYLYDHEFDEIFHYGVDDIYELEGRIE